MRSVTLLLALATIIVNQYQKNKHNALFFDKNARINATGLMSDAHTHMQWIDNAVKINAMSSVGPVNIRPSFHKITGYKFI